MKKNALLAKTAVLLMVLICTAAALAQDESSAQPEQAVTQDEPSAQPEQAAAAEQPDAEWEPVVDEFEPEIPQEPEQAAAQDEPSVEPEQAVTQDEPSAQPEPVVKQEPVVPQVPVAKPEEPVVTPDPVIIPRPSVAAQEPPAAAPGRQTAGKHRVAVYMAGEEPAGAKGAYHILGTELAKAISNSEAYSAVDRTDDILKQIDREHIYQRSGAVSDEQIADLGKQLGVNYLCVARVNEIKGGAYFLEARLVNVETAEVLGIASAESGLKNAAEMVAAARQVARGLIAGEITDYAEPENPAKIPGMHINIYTGGHSASHDGGGSNSGVHLGLGAAGFLRAEHLHKFGVIIGLGVSIDTYTHTEDAYKISMTGASMHVSPIYRVGYREKYADAAVTVNIPVTHDIYLEVPGSDREKMDVDAKIEYAVDVAVRYRFAGVNAGYSLIGGVAQFGVCGYIKINKSMEVVPSARYYLGDGWGQIAAAVGVNVMFW